MCIMIMERTQNDEKTSEFTVLIRKYYFYGGFVMKFRLTAIALVLCLLILPMNVTAIVVGEDTAPAGYIEYLQYDIDTRETTTQYAPINNSTETWSLFTEREVSQMAAALYTEQNGIVTNNYIGETNDLETTNPNNVLTSSAVVLIIAYLDGNGDGVADVVSRGTGFLVSHNVLVTAAHCVVTGDGYTLIEARAYYDVHGSSYSGCNYVTLDRLMWSYGYTSTSPDVQMRYDYCIATLNGSIEREFYFNCANSTSIQNISVTVSGYPNLNAANGFNNYYYQCKSEGSILSVSEYNITYDNDTIVGMSGGPVFRLGTAYGINTMESTTHNLGVRIHSQVYTTICDAIERYS